MAEGRGAGGDERDRRVAKLEAELAAARRTIEVLADRVERSGLHAEAARFALQKAIANLEDSLRQRARELEASEAHYRTLYEASPDAILTVDEQCRVLTCNRTAEALFGRSADELVGAELSELLEPDSGATFTGLLWTGFVGVGESDVRLANGRQVSFSVARLDEGRILVVFRDVTGPRRLEEQLVRSQRLAGIGRLAAALAQEINNPLAVIQGRLELMRASGTVPAEQLRRHVDVLLDHCRRIAFITRNLQMFAAPRAPSSQPIPLHRLLSDGQSLGGSRLARVRLSTDDVPDDLLVLGDPDQLAQLFANLLLAAAEASPRGGAVVVEAKEEAGQAHVAVTYSGRWLPEALLEELRSPYAHETRHIDPAFGLGLAICWAIAQDHGGTFTAENLEPSGCRFHLRLPVPGGRARGEAGGGGARRLDILVVDDDRMLCETLVWMLREEGHRIVAVHSAEEALARLGRERFDALVIDIALPGMDGERLVEAIERRWPGTGRRAILTSGRLLSPRRDNVYLQKPFRREQLLAVLRSVLEGEGEAG